MSTTQHPRKSGVTTVKKDGKIVGNIGVGKTKTPREIKAHKPSQNSPKDPASTIMLANDKFKNLDGRHMTAEQVLTIWNMLPAGEWKKNFETYGFLLKDADVQTKKDTIAHVIPLTLQGHPDPDVARMFAHEENMADCDHMAIVEVVDALSYHKVDMVRLIAAKSPFALPKTLRRLSEENSFNINSRLCSNHRTPWDVLEKLANSDNMNFRRVVATSPYATSAMLEKLSTDEQWIVKKRVGANKKTSAEVLENMAERELAEAKNADNRNTSYNVAVLSVLEMNENTPKNVRRKIVEYLYGDRDY